MPFSLQSWLGKELDDIIASIGTRNGHYLKYKLGGRYEIRDNEDASLNSVLCQKDCPAYGKTTTWALKKKLNLEKK